jgi:prepilin-type N-terminal cleavage/methylation domain-containing protein
VQELAAYIAFGWQHRMVFMKRIEPRAQRGFSLLEVLIAMAILSVGLLALLGLFAVAVGAVQHAQEDLIAKQKAREVLEGIYAARNDSSIGWDQIQNVSAGGIFEDGFQDMQTAGPDGIVGTGDDGAIEEINGIPLTNFQRQIAIGSVPGSSDASLRQVTVTIRCFTTGAPRDYAVSGYISKFR